MATPGEAPHNVSYEDESSGAYVVREPDAREVVVPKARTSVEQSSIEDRQTAFAGRLVRWSAFALVGVVLGGIGGVVLGLPAVIVTAAQLTGHSQRVRRWRSEHPGPNGPLPLPAPATTERLRLLTAFWQALLALAFGAVVFAFLTGRVL